MTTYTHGTTLEVFEEKGHKVHRVCCHGGGMCRYAKNAYEAQDFIRTFEEFSSYYCA